MHLSRLLAARYIPALREVSPEEFRTLVDSSKVNSKPSLRRWGGWILVAALVLPFVLFIALPAFWLSEHGISLAWLVVLIPLAVLASSAVSEMATLFAILPELRRETGVRRSQPG